MITNEDLLTRESFDDAIISSINNMSSTVLRQEDFDKKYIRLEAGTYEIKEPIKLKGDLIGLSSKGSVVIRVSDDFVGEGMIDFLDCPYYTKMINITLDAKSKDISHLFTSSSSSHNNGAIHSFEHCRFVNSNVVSVNAHALDNSAGFITGSSFRNCSWDGNKYFFNTSTNIDDIIFDTCRFAMRPNGIINSTQEPFRMFGNNIKFLNCYFYLSKTDYSYFDIKAFFYFANESMIGFDNNFFESNDTNFVYLIRETGADFNLNLTNTTFRLYNSDPKTYSSFTSLVRCDTGNKVRGKNLYVNTLRTDIQFTLLNVQEVIGKNNPINLTLSNVDVLNKLYTIRNNGNNEKTIILHGIYKGKHLAGFVNYTSDYSEDGRHLYRIESTENSKNQIFNLVLPSTKQKAYLANIQVRCNGNSGSHMAWGTYVIYVSPSGTGILSTQQIGSNNIIGNVKSINVSNPDINGNVIISTSQVNEMSSIALVRLTEIGY